MLNIVIISLLVLNSGIYSQDNVGEVEDIIKFKETNDNPTVQTTNDKADNVIASTSSPNEDVTSKPVPAENVVNIIKPEDTNNPTVQATNDKVEESNNNPRVQTTHDRADNIIPSASNPIEDVASKLVSIQAATKQAPALGLTPEQIDKLADKILMIHGVETSPQTPEDYEKVERLKNVVAKVENNLENKLKETAEKAKEDKLKNENLEENRHTNPVTQEEDIGEVNIIKESIGDNADLVNKEAEITSVEANKENKLDVIIDNEDKGEKIEEIILEENGEIEERIEVVDTANINNNTEAGGITEEAKIAVEALEADVEAAETATEEENVIEENLMGATKEDKVEDTTKTDIEEENVIQDNLTDATKEDKVEDADNLDTLSPILEDANLNEEIELNRNVSPTSEEEVDESDLETCNAEKNDCDQGGKKYLYSMDDNLNREEKLEAEIENGYFDKFLNFIYARF